jgi:hypothetical protein
MHGQGDVVYRRPIRERKLIDDEEVRVSLGECKTALNAAAVVRAVPADDSKLCDRLKRNIM